MNKYAENYHFLNGLANIKHSVGEIQSDFDNGVSATALRVSVKILENDVNAFRDLVWRLEAAELAENDEEA